MMRTRSFVRVVCALFLLAAVLRADDGDHRTRREWGDDSNQADFILCARPDRVAAIASRHGLTIIRPLDVHVHDVFLVRGQVSRQDTDAVRGDSLDTFTQQLLRDVRSDPDVVHFDINGTSVVTEIGSSPTLSASTVEILDSLSRTPIDYFGTSVWTGYVSQPAMGVIHLGQAQQIADGRGIVVAVIDTGVDPHHPALVGSLVPGYDFTRDLAGAGSEWTDLNASTVEILDSAGTALQDPGTPVAVNPSTTALVDPATASLVDLSLLPHAFGHGTMVAGLVHVVAPAAKIMPLKVFDAYGNSTTFDIERAIYYAVDHGAKVINMSFSSANTTAEIAHAIDYASSHGVICLASVGNSGRSDMVFPAGYRNVMAIGSTSLVDERSPFTNFGDHLVQFAAPGETLVTLYPGGRYAAVSGTSFSTAMMAGAAGLMSQLVPTLDQRLAGRYFDDGAFRRSGLELGSGRINLFESLRAHGPVNAPPPITPTLDATAPTVTFAAPLWGAVVTGTYQVLAAASDDVGVAGVQFALDGAVLGEATSAPYALSWDSTTTSGGAHLLAAIARDAAGNQSTTTVAITVVNDTAAPAVTIAAPSPGAGITGTITISATASDDVGVAGVQFTLDGVNLGAELASAPYALSWSTGSVANGPHVLGAVARDAAGNHTSASVTATVFNDVTAPAVALTSPAEATTVTGTISLQASATDDVGVVGVQFTLDGATFGVELTTEPYAVSWSSGSVANGVHVLGAVARDAAGNQRTVSVTVTVFNDSTPPTVAWTSPAGATTVTGTISLAASASDDVAVAGVQLTLDGVNLGAELASAPYALSWNTGSVANGPHVLGVIARDAAGNHSNASVTVTVFNDITAPAVAVTSPAADGSSVTGTITLAAIASDDVGVAGVQWTIDGVNLGVERATQPYAMSWNSGSVANGVHVLGAVARDAAGNHSNASITVTVFNDITAPSVAVTAPVGDGTTATGTIALAANAADDVGVGGVQFTLDGVNLGAEISTGPYEMSWSTVSVANGAHVVGAIARDAAGNQRSVSVNITVANDTTAPTVAITSPAQDGASVTGTITVQAGASDDVGVVGVQFAIDGVSLGAEVATAPYTVDWDSTAVADGEHVVSATARDAAGHQQTVNLNVLVTNHPPTT